MKEVWNVRVGKRDWRWDRTMLVWIWASLEAREARVYVRGVVGGGADGEDMADGNYGSR